MPIYEFVCNDCENQFETIVFSKSEQVTCPKCKSEKIRKKMSCCAFKTGDNNFVGTGKRAMATGGGCSGCSATSCGTCGH